MTEDSDSHSGALAWFRRSLGLPWLIGLVVIPLLLAGIGYGVLDQKHSSGGPTGVVPTLSPTDKNAGPKISLAPVAIVRKGNDVTLTGQLPDDPSKAALVKVLKTSLPPGINLIDQIQLTPGVAALDFANAGPFFHDMAPIAAFRFTVNADTITVTGDAGSQQQKDAAVADAKHIWPNLDIVDQLTVKGVAAPPSAACADLQKAINTVTGGPIVFGDDGFSLTPGDEQILSQTADKLKACPAARVLVKGYADNTGNEVMNATLSTQRAQTVADSLTAHGVPRNAITVKGLGSVDPVAPNDTADGRAKNRRVELVVS
jgi:peptidoglycan-binding protein ArfA